MLRRCTGLLQSVYASIAVSCCMCAIAPCHAAQRTDFEPLLLAGVGDLAHMNSLRMGFGFSRLEQVDSLLVVLSFAVAS